MAMSAAAGTSSSAELRRVKSSEVGMLARLRSISDDADWLRHDVFARIPNVPFFLNKRCGSWYYDPQLCQSSYFKSTDGHPGSWAFNLARLNLHCLVECIGKGSVVIVDSTRYGKRFSDALVRTVPIWCAVINTVRSGHSLATPASELLPPWVPPSERDQIDQLVAKVVAGLDSAVRSAILNAGSAAPYQPLRPVYWCQPSSSMRPTSAVHQTEAAWASVAPALDDLDNQGDAHYVICVNASRFVDEHGDLRSSHEGWRYVPGAGDDAENWCKVRSGDAQAVLTPALFWAHKSELLSCRSDAECASAVVRLRASVDATAQPEPAVASDATIAGDDWVSALVARLQGLTLVTGTNVGVATVSSEPSREEEIAQPLVLILVRPWHAAQTSAPPGITAQLIAKTDRDCSALVLTLPVDKAGMRRFSEEWVLEVFPAVSSLVLSHQSSDCTPGSLSAACIVGCEDRHKDVEGLAQVIAAVAAAASLCSKRLEGGMDKEVIRAAVACAALAAGAPSVERWLAKELNRWLLSD